MGLEGDQRAALDVQVGSHSEWLSQTGQNSLGVDVSETLLAQGSAVALLTDMIGLFDAESALIVGPRRGGVKATADRLLTVGWLTYFSPGSALIDQTSLPGGANVVIDPGGGLWLRACPVREDATRELIADVAGAVRGIPPRRNGWFFR